MRQPARPTPWKDLCPWIIPAALAAYALFFSYLHGTQVLYWDSWGDVEVVTGAKPFGWSFLWGPKNEHRLLWQNAFTFAWARLTHWDNAASILFLTLMICAGAFLILRRAFARHRDLSFPQKILFGALLSAWLLTLRQYDNMTWPHQFNWALLFLIVALFQDAWEPFARDGRGFLKVSALMTACIGAGFDGLAVIAYPLGHALMRWGSGRLRPREASLGLLSIFLMGTYLWGLSPSGRGALLWTPLLRPVHAAAYGLVYLGNSFIIKPDALPAAFGLALFLLFIAAWRLRATRGEEASLAAVYAQRPLLFIGLFMFLFVLIGRLPFGVTQGGASRYVTRGLLLAVDLWLFSFEGVSRYFRKSSTFFLAICLALLSTSWVFSAIEASCFAGRRQRALDWFAQSVLYFPEDPSKWPTDNVHPDRDLLTRRVELLRGKDFGFFYGRRAGISRRHPPSPPS